MLDAPVLPGRQRNLAMEHIEGSALATNMFNEKSEILSEPGMRSLTVFFSHTTAFASIYAGAPWLFSRTEFERQQQSPPLSCQSFWQTIASFILILHFPGLSLLSATLR